MDIEILNGPDKPALQWALAYPDKGQRVHFSTEDDAFEATIDRMSERSDGLEFNLVGRIATGPKAGSTFSGSYSVETRRGILHLN
jgi:hypothetical protein